MSRGPDSQQDRFDENDSISGFFPAPRKEKLSSKRVKVDMAKMESGVILGIYTGDGTKIGKIKLNQVNSGICSYSLILPDLTEILLCIPKQVSDEIVTVRYVVGTGRLPAEIFGPAAQQIAAQHYEILVDSRGNLALRDCGTDNGTFMQRSIEQDKNIETPEGIEQIPCGESGDIEGIAGGREFYGGTNKIIGNVNLSKDLSGSVNEDNIGVNTKEAVFALADGVGSGVEGEIAAHRAVKSVIENGRSGIARAAYIAGYNNWYLNAFMNDPNGKYFSDTCIVTCKIEGNNMEVFSAGDSYIVVIAKVENKPKIIFRTIRDSGGAGKYDVAASGSSIIGSKEKVTERDLLTEPKYVSTSNVIYNSLFAEVANGCVSNVNIVDVPEDAYVVMLSDGMSVLDHELIDCVYGHSPKEAYNNLYNLIRKKNSSAHENEYGFKVPEYLQNFNDGKDDAYIRPPLDNGSCIVIGPKSF